ncbi:MAG: radical SAM protein [Bacteroidetes bacterium]|nr:MAG: radical SAM protein [Bacteroidota bacterium]
MGLQTKLFHQIGLAPHKSYPLALSLQLYGKPGLPHLLEKTGQRKSKNFSLEMQILFIQPAVGKKAHTPYTKTWQMEPLAIAVLSAITPPHIEKIFFDDRIEEIPYDHPADLVAITLETYTARRAYEIAAGFRKRGKTIVMGGFHATLATQEVMQHADVVVTGQAEGIWQQLLEDFATGKLKKLYQSKQTVETTGIIPDRKIFQHKKYLPIGLIESSRGCTYHCEFCSVYGFYKKCYHSRNLNDIVTDIKQSGKKFFFIVDDNIALDREKTLAFCEALKPLKINWFGQVSIHIGNDPQLLKAMHESGCIGVLIGFESFRKENIRQMDKKVNERNTDYQMAIDNIRKHRLMIYGTFVFGYENDTQEDFDQVLAFARKNKLFMNAFNHLVPFPGTPMYERFKAEGKLLHENWWLMDGYTFGKAVFNPGILNAEQLTHLCYTYRKKFFTWSSILKRSTDLKANLSSVKKAMVYFMANLSSRKDVEIRQGLPLGKNDNQ